MSRVVGTIICLLALCLPCRLRLMLCEVLGWLFQVAHLVVYSIARFILRSLEK